MRGFIRLALASVCLCVLPAYGAGKFKWLAQNSSVFMKIELEENNGLIEGKLTSSGGVTPLTFMVDEKQLVSGIGPQSFTFNVAQSGGGSKRYNGRGLDQRDIEGSCFINSKKKYLIQDGRVQFQSKQINYRMTQDEKKRSFYLEFDKMVFKFLGVKNKPGKSTGTIQWDTQQTGTILVESSGSLEDLFFKNCDHPFAWLVNLFVYPDN